MQGETGHHPAYAHHIPMDLHVPQHFPYYAGCIMDNQAMFTAQHMQYNKLYGAGLDTAVRRIDDLSDQSSLNSRYGHHPILELRKEKSRDAARSRRGKENYEFYELAKMLPLPGAITSQWDKASVEALISQLDKASIVRLTIAYLRLRDFANHGEPPWNRDGRFDGKSNMKPSALRRGVLGSSLAIDMFEEHEGTHILQSLDGFAISLAADGRFLYISETVSIYLGLSQVELSGSSIFDYVHQSDHQELADQLGVTLAGPGDHSPHPGEEGGSGTSGAGPAPPIPDGKPCKWMKSTLTKRGCHFKVRLETDMFVTRLAFDFKIAHCEPKVSDMLDYTAEELTGKSMYTLCHAGDLDKIKQTHTDWALYSNRQIGATYNEALKKGDINRFNSYRDLGLQTKRSGGYTWVQTCATLVCNTKNSEEQTIICVNYVLSGPQYPHIVMDTDQMEHGDVHVKQDIDSPLSNQSPMPLQKDDRQDFVSYGASTAGDDRSDTYRAPAGATLERQSQDFRAGYTAEDSCDQRSGKTSLEAAHARLRSPVPSPHTTSTPHPHSSPHPSVTPTPTTINAPMTPTPIVANSSVISGAGTAGSNSFSDDTEDRASNRTSSPVHVSSPSSGISSLPDQNSNSVRELENAMSKHLPDKQQAQLQSGGKKQQQAASPLHLPLPGVSSSLGATSDLIKQFYSRHGSPGAPVSVGGYSPHHPSPLDSPHHPTHNPVHGHSYLDYTSRLNSYTNVQHAAAAAALKPYSMSATASMMTAASPPGLDPAGVAAAAWHPDAAANLYSSHHAAAASFHLNQQRGQTWYTGN